MLIFPAIDMLGGQCVRLFQGDYSQETVYANDPVAMAQTLENAGFTHLHLVDLEGAKAKKSNPLEPGGRNPEAYPAHRRFWRRDS